MKQFVKSLNKVKVLSIYGNRFQDLAPKNLKQESLMVLILGNSLRMINLSIQRNTWKYAYEHRFLMGWKTFGNHRVENKELTEKLLKSLQNIGANMRIFYIAIQMNFRIICGDWNGEQRERFHQDIKTKVECSPGLTNDGRLLMEYQKGLK